MKKTTNNNDKRFLRTKEILCDSLLTLLETKSIAEISTTELCAHAHISRNTFYSHYNNPMELLETIEEDAYLKAIPFFEELDPTGDIVPTLTKLYQLVYDNPKLYSAIISKNGDSHFLKRTSEMRHDLILHHWKQADSNLSDDQMELLYSFFVGGNFLSVRNWTQNGLKQTPQELAEFMAKTYSTLAKSYFNFPETK